MTEVMETKQEHQSG